MRLLESQVKEDMNVIDVGTNVGITTLAIARKIGKRGELYSFKPVPEYYNTFNF